MPSSTPYASLAIAVVCGLLIGIERGWRARHEAAGSRVAGLRTFTLLGGLGGLIGVLSTLVHPFVPGVLLAGLVVGLVAAHLRAMNGPDDVSVTMLVAALITVVLGLLATLGFPLLALASAAIVTLILALRTELHGLLAQLGEADVKALARFAIIAGAILPFMPNEAMGPYGAWNPQQLWLVVVIVTGLSFLGYVANRLVGQRYGTLATAAIGGVYSSTAVTVTLAQQLRDERQDAALIGAAIALASAMMLLRTLILAAMLARFAFASLLPMALAALAVSVLAGLLLYRRSRMLPNETGFASANPLNLIPALGFVVLIAGLAVAVRWAEQRFGGEGIAILLLIVGLLDVDAATVTMGGLSPGVLEPKLAGVLLAGPLVANSVFKAVLVGLNGNWARNWPAFAPLLLVALTLAVGAAIIIWV
jgi:uncharacterized membrane protein (DUF4010 family)